MPEFRQVADSRRDRRGGPSSFFSYSLLFFPSFSCLLLHHPSLTEVIFSSLPARHTATGPPRRPFTLPGYQLCPRGPHVATADPPVCVSHLHEGGGPDARLVIPRRGRRNPCVRSLRSYKVQFKKILSSFSLSPSTPRRGGLVTPSRLVSSSRFLVLAINRATVGIL